MRVTDIRQWGVRYPDGEVSEYRSNEKQARGELEFARKRGQFSKPEYWHGAELVSRPSIRDEWEVAE